MDIQQQRQSEKAFHLKTSSEALTRSAIGPVYDGSKGEMAIYSGDGLDIETAERIYLRLMAAFPKMTEPAATLIIERMSENGFTNARAIDAVNYVIDTYEGWDKVPSVSNFIRCWPG